MMRDTIRISKIKAFGYHGVLPEEQKLGQDFFVSLELESDFRECSKNDDLSCTTNYAKIVDCVIEIVQTRPAFKLIETLAEKIAQEIFLRFPRISRIRLEIHKPNAPIPAEFEDVSIKIERERP